MASSRRPAKPRRCAPKAAKARPAAARPSTSKPRAQGKLGPVSSKPATLELPSRSEIQLVRKVEMARQDREKRLADCEAEIAALRKEVATLVGEARRLMALSETIQLACKRLRSALGPLGQGADDRSTTGHMLAMIEELIEQRNSAGHFERVAHGSIIRMRSALGEVVRAAGLHQAIPDDLASITGRMIEALKQASSQNQNQEKPYVPESLAELRKALDGLRPVAGAAPGAPGEPSDQPVVSGTAAPPAGGEPPRGEQLPFRMKLGEPTVVCGTVVQWRSPQPANAATSELEPGMHNGPCEDLDGSGACFGCGRWLGDAPTSDAASPKDPAGGTP